MEVLKFILRAVDRLSSALRWIAYVCLAVIMVVVIYEVASRYLFNMPTSFSFDIAMVFQVFLVTLGAPFVLREEGHISITLLTEKFPKRLDHYFLSITSGVCAVIAGIMTYQLWIFSVDAWQVNELRKTLGMPLAPVKFIMTAGFAILTMQFLVRMWKNFLIIRSKGEI
jgi:TRAP-type C4-dicarboxylate transport system permease small subunit